MILKALTRLQRSAGDGGVREIELLEAVGPYGVSRSHLRDSLALALDSVYVERSGPRDQHWIMSAEGLAANEMNMRNAIRCLSVEEEAGEAGA